MGIVITNGYRGTNIEKLIAPTPEARFETFKQIMQHNFTVYTEFSSDALMTFDQFQKYFYKDNKSKELNSTQKEIKYNQTLDRYNRLMSTKIEDSRLNLIMMNILKMERRLLMAAFQKASFGEIDALALDVNTVQFDEYEKVVDLIVHNVKLPETYADVMDSHNPDSTVTKLSACSNKAFIGNHKRVGLIATKLRRHLKIKFGSTFSYEMVSFSKESLCRYSIQKFSIICHQI